MNVKELVVNVSVSVMYKWCLYIQDNDLSNWEFDDIYDTIDEVSTRITGILKHHKDSKDLVIRVTKEKERQ